MVELYPKFPFNWENRKQWLHLPFPRAEYSRRVENLRKAMAGSGFDSFLICGNREESFYFGHVRYISNFDSHIGYTVIILPASGELTLITDSVFHGEPMHSGIWETWIEDCRQAFKPEFALKLKAPNLFDGVAKAIGDKKLQRAKFAIVGENFLPFGFVEKLKEGFPGARFQVATRLFREVKSLKGELELEMMRKVNRLGCLGLEAAMEAIRPGATEVEVAGLVDYAMMKGGAEMASKATAFVAGPRSGLKHVFPSERPMEQGEMYFLDIGARYAGYQCDLARCGVVGKPSQRQLHMLETSIEMAQGVIDMIKPGLKASALAEVAQRVAEKAGWADAYCPLVQGHGLGTGFIDIPYLSPYSDDILQQGHTIAIEPMLTEPGFGTAVCENMVAVTSSGYELLSDFKWRTW